MQHDKIMMSSSPDFVLVENEAQTVARQASLALKQSRRRINSRPGVPTWTGQHGVAGAPRVTYVTTFLSTFCCYQQHIIICNHNNSVCIGSASFHLQKQIIFEILSVKAILCLLTYDTHNQ